VAAPDATARGATGSSPHASPGQETILVVDDDEGARQMLARYLKKHGHTVLMASDGLEAKTLLELTDRVDLVIADAVMPHMGGRALFDAVTQTRPTLPFLFCSGYPAGTISAEILESPRCALLAKPFTEEALLAEVRRLLDVSEG